MAVLPHPSDFSYVRLSCHAGPVETRLVETVAPTLQERRFNGGAVAS